MNRVRAHAPGVLFTVCLAFSACGAGGQPEIVQAVAAQDVERVRQLISRGTDVNDRGNGEWTAAIHYTRGNEEILKLLLEADADPNSPDPTSTVLGEYALGGKTSAVELLLTHGAAIDVQDVAYGDTALHKAATNGNLEVVQLLVERGADATVRNKQGQTAYDAAAEYPNQPDRQAVMRYLEPEKHPVPVADVSPGTKVLRIRYSGLFDRDEKRCFKLTLENISGKTLTEFFGGIEVRRVSTGDYLYSLGYTRGIGTVTLQPGEVLETELCPDESRGAELLSLLESDPGSVEFIYNADRVRYGDGSEEAFSRL